MKPNASTTPDVALVRKHHRRPVFWGYCRVSTTDQDADCLPQKQVIKATYEGKWARTHAWGGYFVDPAVSGVVNFGQRPAGSVALEALRPGDALCGAKLDRLSRSLLDIVHLIRTCEGLAVSLVACDLGIDTSTSVGKLVAHIIAAVAEWERERIGERTLEGVRAKTSRGYQNGGSRPKAGFTMWKDGKLIPNLTEQLLMKKLHDLNNQGYSLNVLAKSCADAKVFSPRKGEENKPLNRTRIDLYIKRWAEIAGTSDDITAQHFDVQDGQPLADPFEKIEETLCAHAIESITRIRRCGLVPHKRGVPQTGLRSST